jgi:hypothetical protein
MREGYVKLDLAVSIPTFVGSSLSFLAASTVLLLQLIYPPGRHFRHALIVNLLISGERSLQTKREKPTRVVLY